MTRSIFGSDTAAVWRPNENHLTRSRLAAAMRRWGFDSLPALHAASVQQPDWFWAEAAADLGLALQGNLDPVRDVSGGHEFPQWFPNATYNVVWGCVDRHAADPAQAARPAFVYEADSGARRVLTFAEMKREVDVFAAAMRKLGLHKGDRVALFMPPCVEAAVALLGAAKIGAILVPAFSGYGPDPLAARVQASAAKVIVTVDSTTRRGKKNPMKDVASAAAVNCPTVESVIVVRLSGESVEMESGRDYWWHELTGAVTDEAAAQPAEPCNPNDPLLIMYTSGTTGAPKGIVHSHFGYVMKSAVDFGYAFDVQGDDAVAWISDMGWMVGPQLVFGMLHLGATTVLVEGLPDYPEADRIWRIVERNRVTLLGVAPTAIRGLKSKWDGQPIAADLSSLRAFASTGEAWDEPSWQWLFNEVGGARLPILNYSGGTEVGGGILSCYTIAPQSPASFSGPLLGLDVDVFDGNGQSTDEIGEIVIRNTWPGMAHGFWGDRERYLDTYWSRWDKVWVHGDLSSVSEEGYWYIHGRSDDTLKIGGRRVGPSEIESALVAQGLVEAAAIGVPDEVRGQSIVGFVVAREDAAPVTSEALIEAVSKVLGKAMAPSRIHFVAGLPKTRNGKIMRRAIRARYLGDPPGDLSSHDPLTPLEHIPTQS